MVKNSRARVTRPGEGHGAAYIEVGPDRTVIRLPNPQLITLVARSVFLITVIVSFSRLRATVLDADLDASTSAMARDQIGRAGESVLLPMLFRDLNHQGLLRHGDKALFLGNPGSWLSMFLKKNQIEVVAERRISTVAYRTCVFVFAENGFDEAGFRLIDRVLKVGGIVGFRLVTFPAHSFSIPSNYMISYIRRFGSTVVALKKTANVDPDPTVVNCANSGSGRRLLAFLRVKEALEGLEDVLFEPPRSRRVNTRKYWKKTKYLPNLTGDSLEGYSRRVFVDVGTPGRAESTGWFKKRYPTKNQRFEMIRVDVAGEEGKGAMTAGEWLERNVKEEEYVVMKAEAEVLEEMMLKGGSVRLVDELFLECKNSQWRSKGMGKSRRAYWECLALYGKLRDKGVAVHQWWG